MQALGPNDLIAAWDGGALDEAAHARLGRVLARALPGAAIERDTLGRRNQRLIALHGLLLGGAIEAVAACPVCGAANELNVPTDAIAALGSPAADARVPVASGPAALSARLPCMADLAAIASVSPEDAPVALAAACLGSGAEVTPELVAALEAAFEMADPAAVVRLATACAECGQPMAVEVDLAAFVATAIERLVERHLREIDLIARAYGWTEAEILSLSPARRARYVALLSGEAPRRTA
ncbi:hypothetical protein [Sphingomonas nostoxanthinifaciens]|uniref:hypothetical protein n=1 Tax=Sphingomonas nostoxanthinifaciens TaxID=2872652 RepID=UPI001CC1CB68|nr:hypothetical protein [Sphingomonas nostoxanthinifaciens]UAK23299.1 hypothetical protein K8P63_12905 [Sphingomonas nostoxanthinifaciens]